MEAAEVMDIYNKKQYFTKPSTEKRKKKSEIKIMTKAARAYDIIRGVFGDGIKFIKRSIRKDLPELKSTKIVKPTIKRNSTEFYKSKTLQEKGYEASKIFTVNPVYLFLIMNS